MKLYFVGRVGHIVNKNVLCAVVMLGDGKVNVIVIVTVDELKIMASLLYA
jgi:ribosomal protein L21E